MYKNSSNVLPDIPSLTGLRFWAAFFILQNHLLLGFVSRDNQLFKNLLNAGASIGMSIFFILSGFIIHYNYHRKLFVFSFSNFYDFIAARFSRLYPLYIFLFVLDVLTTNQTFGQLKTDDVIDSLKYFFTMTQTWLYFKNSSGELIAHMFHRSSISWSISTEFLLYFTYPLTLYFLKFDNLKKYIKIFFYIFLILLFSMGLSYLSSSVNIIDSFAVKYFGADAGIQKSGANAFVYWFIFLSPYVRIFEFLIGIFICHLYLNFKDDLPWEATASILQVIGIASICFIAATFLPDLIRFQSLMWLYKTIGYYPAIAIIILICARYPSSSINKYFSNKVFVSLGEYSYSIYLFHIYVYYAASHVVNSVDLSFIQIIVVWMAIFSSAHILFRYIEMPYRKQFKDNFGSIKRYFFKGC